MKHTSLEQMFFVRRFKREDLDETRCFCSRVTNVNHTMIKVLNERTHSKSKHKQPGFKGMPARRLNYINMRKYDIATVIVFLRCK